MSEMLVMRFSSMGDVICAASLFSFVKKAAPRTRIRFVTQRLYAGLFDNDPRLSACVGIDAENQETEFAALQGMGFNRIVDLQNSRRSAALRRRYFSAIPTGLFDKRHAARTLLLLTRINAYGRIDSVARRYIAATGLKPGPDQEIPAPRLFLSPSEQHNLTSIFEATASRSTLALIPFCAWPNKQWDLGSFREVGRHFQDMDWNILIVGGPAEVELADALAKDIGPAACSVAGSMSLAQLGGVLSQCRLALGGDTGLSHLARAVGVKTGILFGPTTRHFGFYPFGLPRFTVFERQLFCRPCHPHGGTRCWRMNRACLAGISVREVVDGLEALDQECQS
jgi:ADP-heptose:LPS heptosyltransferase